MTGDDQSAWPRRASRAIVATFGLALLFTASLPGAETAQAGDLSTQISSTRRSQRYSESVMRSQDRQLVKIKRQRKVSKRNLKRATRSLKRRGRQLANARRIVNTRQERLADFEARYADATEPPDPAAYKARLRKLRRDLRIAQDRKQVLGRHVRRATRARRASKRRIASLRRQARVAVGRRESAEGALAASIVQMTRLAQLRADNQTDLRLSSDGTTFAWPSTGRISQGYGCTGFRFNPPRGSCRHFHDGLDIVSAYGSSVRSAAIGVVAYVGWNPWDQRSRAFIVVVGHPDGFVTRYGHLLPTRKVRVGQLVHKGQRVGRMGNTGNSTGTHLHMELLRGTTPVDPLAYLPTRVTHAASPKRSGDKKARARQQREDKRAKAKRARQRRTQQKRAQQKRARDSGQKARQRARAAAKSEPGPTGDADARIAVQPPFQAALASCDPLPAADVESGSMATVDGSAILGELITDATSSASGEPAECDTDDPVPAAEAADRSVDRPIGPSIPIRRTSPTPY